MKLLVIGGARFSGRALTGLALDAGHDVTIFHRGTSDADPWPAAEHVHGDRHEGFGALNGRSFDAVVDTCAFVPSDLDGSGAAFADTGRYLFVSSLSAHIDAVRAGATEDDDVYEPPFPQTEEVTNETYGPLKVASERALRARFGDRALVVRPGYIVGPHDPTDRFTYWVRRAARGGEMVAPGGPQDVWQWVDARDLAAFMLACCERRLGGTYNVVTPPGRHSIGELLDLSRAAAGADTSFAWIDEAFAQEQGLLDDEDGPLPMWTPGLPGFERFDTTRAERAGLVCRPLVETVRDTLRWDTERGAPWPMRAGLDDERERALLEAWHRTGSGGAVGP